MYITRPQSKEEHGICCELKVIPNLIGIVSSKLKADIFGSELRKNVESYLDKHISGLGNIMCKIRRLEEYGMFRTEGRGVWGTERMA